MVDILDAARLISASLHASHHRPDAEVTDLRNRYGDDLAFRNAVQDLAAGLGLQVLGTTSTNLVTGASSTSPFAMSLSDIPGLTGTDDRLLLGLAVLGAVSYCYPRSGAVDDSRTLTVDPKLAADELTEACDDLLEQHPPDTPVDHEELRTAWRLWTQLPKVEHTDAGNLKARGSRLWFMTRACELLADQRLLVLAADGRYRTTEALRVHVTHGAHQMHLNIMRPHYGHTGRAVAPADNQDA